MLTLYERLPAEELPFYLNLIAHLANAGVQAPAPEPDRSGALWSILNGKPAGLVARLEGAAVVRPDTAHCAAAGAVLAQMHVAAGSYRSRLSNRRGPGWWRQAARAVRPFLSAGAERADRRPSSSSRAGLAKVRLPRGAIHGDLFCDNVLFEDTRVSGVIDFGFAATDAFIYDLAIAVNDWCVFVDAGREGALDSSARRGDGRRVYGPAPGDGRRTVDVGAVAARRRAPLLAVAPLRPAPAPPGRDHVGARSGGFRAHPARPHCLAAASARMMSDAPIAFELRERGARLRLAFARGDDVPRRAAALAAAALRLLSAGRLSRIRAVGDRSDSSLRRC